MNLFEQYYSSSFPTIIVLEIQNKMYKKCLFRALWIQQVSLKIAKSQNEISCRKHLFFSPYLHIQDGFWIHTKHIRTRGGGYSEVRSFHSKQNIGQSNSYNWQKLVRIGRHLSKKFLVNVTQVTNIQMVRCQSLDQLQPISHFRIVISQSLLVIRPANASLVTMCEQDQ